MTQPDVLERKPANAGRPRTAGRTRDRGRERGRQARQPQSTRPNESDQPGRVIAGIVDIVKDRAIIRTDGYAPGPDDVAVPPALAKRYRLRRGDAVTGEATGNTLTRLHTVHDANPESTLSRPEFHDLTPLYPQERLRLETEPHILTTRVIDLVMPIGKGQRALIVSPPKAGKTMVLQSIANAITRNNPECHLMVVLVDERPEEVTDMQRSVKGEVIASTFDRPPTDHAMVAELSIERAKRLVELGQDVVVLLDSITRLGRAYNNASTGNGRTLSGGVDANALYPPKRFLGAARNIEGGGSLTVIATALVDTGSAGDMLIFEEYKGTGNAELRLDRKLADRRIFPAIDVDASGTRNDDILLHSDEAAAVRRLRRAIAGQQATEQLVERLAKTGSNAEFLMALLRR